MIRYTVREENYKKISNGKWIETKGVVIFKYDVEDNLLFPSKFTEYITTALSRCEINTQIKHSRTITAFLNFVLEQVELGEDELFDVVKKKGFYGLNLFHVAKFITYTTENTDNAYKTVKDKENELIRFMWFLNKRKITGKEGKIESAIVPKGRQLHKGKRTLVNNSKVNGSTKGTRVWLNPFEEDNDKYIVKYPKKGRNNNTLKDLNQDIWEQLIEYAEKYYPQIAFGFALQCMAGLRQGEVVNLILGDIKKEKDKDRLILSIEEHPELFEGRDIQTRGSQIKSTDSSVAVTYNFNGRLMEIYENHLKIIAKTANNISRELGAVFINSDGYPMSGVSYQYYFRCLKEDFLEVLSESAPALTEWLRSQSWGSHIGRHIFTNHLIKNHLVDGVDGTPNITLLQTARRDKNPESAKEYIDQRAVHDAIADTMNKLSMVAINKGEAQS